MEITTTPRYAVNAHPNHWDVWDTKKKAVHERHRTLEAAATSAKRLNGQCLLCGEVHTEEGMCPGSWPRDPNFGAEFDGDDD